MRKNFLFAGSDTGGERAAIAFTIRDLPDLLPAKWKTAHAAAAASTS